MGAPSDAFTSRPVHTTLEELRPQAHDHLEGVGDGDRLDLGEAENVG